MELTEENLKLRTERRQVDREHFERSKTLSRMYMEILRLKAILKERRENICEAVLLGSGANYVESKSVVFTQPFFAGSTYTYVVFTMEGFKGISFTRSEGSNEYTNTFGRVTKTNFEKSLQKFYEGLSDPEAPGYSNRKLSAEFQGFGHTHMGDEVFRCPDPQYNNFEGLLTLDVSPVSDNAIEYALKNLEPSSLDSK